MTNTILLSSNVRSPSFCIPVDYQRPARWYHYQALRVDTITLVTSSHCLGTAFGSCKRRKVCWNYQLDISLSRYSQHFENMASNEGSDSGSNPSMLHGHAAYVAAAAKVRSQSMPSRSPAVSSSTTLLEQNHSLKL